MTRWRLRWSHPALGGETVEFPSYAALRDALYVDVREHGGLIATTLRQLALGRPWLLTTANRLDTRFLYALRPGQTPDARLRRCLDYYDELGASVRFRPLGEWEEE